LVYPDRCEVENLAGKDFESLAGDVLALFRLIPMPNSSDNKRNAEGMLLTFLGASSTLHHHSPECAIPLFKVLGESMDIYKMVGVRAIFKAMIMWPNANSDWLNSLLLSLPNGELSKESMSILKRLTRIFRALSGAVQTHGDAELLKLPKEERRLVEEILPMYRSAINSNA
jgi:hypothetical protein